MKVYNNFSDFVKVPNAIVTIGTFDGVHLGHKAIFNDMIKSAKDIGGETVVITFYPHPRQVLNIDSSNLRFITTQEEKLKLFEESGRPPRRAAPGRSSGTCVQAKARSSASSSSPDPPP